MWINFFCYPHKKNCVWQGCINFLAASGHLFSKKLASHAVYKIKNGNNKVYSNFF